MSRYLPIYLNDQLFQQTVAVELARRARRSNEGTELGAFLAELERELGSDRDELLRRIGRPSRSRVVAARVAERLGRLKLNGHLTTYSPLSRLAELDGLAQLLEGKRGFWLALEEAGLAERAADQRQRLEPHRLAAARVALHEDQPRIRGRRSGAGVEPTQRRVTPPDAF